MMRRVVTFILCLPALGVVVYSFATHPDRSAAPVLAAAALGGFAVLVVLFAMVLPAGMRRLHGERRGEAWRRAAAAALPPSVFFTFVACLLSEQHLRAREAMALAVLWMISLGLAVWWERRVQTRARARR